MRQPSTASGDASGTVLSWLCSCALGMHLCRFIGCATTCGYWIVLFGCLLSLSSVMLVCLLLDDATRTLDRRSTGALTRHTDAGVGRCRTDWPARRPERGGQDRTPGSPRRRRHQHQAGAVRGWRAGGTRAPSRQQKYFLRTAFIKPYSVYRGKRNSR